MLYRPKTTWTTGRNALLQEAIRCPRNYTYFIFMDGNAKIVESTDFGFNTGDPYLTFESYLSRWEPAVAFPGFFADPEAVRNQEVAVTYNFDAIVNAFHRLLFLCSAALWRRNSRRRANPDMSNPCS